MMMGSPRSGNYSCLPNTRFQSLGSDQDELWQIEMLERKRKRMESNRESARRSRKRKQKYVNDLVMEVIELRKENNGLVCGINMSTQMCQNVENENRILKAQIAELTQTLRYLNHIIDLINARRTTTISSNTSEASLNFAMNPMNMLLNHNQPIMASCADMFQW